MDPDSCFYPASEPPTRTCRPPTLTATSFCPISPNTGLVPSQHEACILVSSDDSSDNTDEESEGDNEDDGHGDDDDDAARTGSGPRIQQGHTGRLGCPYRKWNNRLFNPRSHYLCTKSFRDLSQVKSHVKKHHKSKNMFECPRCWKGFSEKDDLAQHQRLSRSKMCIATTRPPQGYQPEDGITLDMFNALTTRGEEFKINTWGRLWRLLFPNTPEVPTPEHEVCVFAELSEAAEVAQQASANATELIRRQAMDMIGDDCLASQLAQQMGSIMEENLVEGFQNLERAALPQCLSHSMARSDRDKPRRSRAKNNRPKKGQNPPGTAVQRQPPRPLAAAPVLERKFPQLAALPPPYHHQPPNPVAFQQQGYNAQFPPASGSMVNPQAWTAITAQATPVIAGPAPIQQSTNLEQMSRFLDWPSQGSPQTTFHTQVHGGHAGPLASSNYPVTQQGAAHGAYGAQNPGPAQQH